MEFLREYLQVPIIITLKSFVQQGLWLVHVEEKGNGLAQLPCLDHLLRVDDSIVLWNVNLSESDGLVRIEADFEKASRFMIQQKNPDAPAKFAEICSGLGGWSHGLHIFGFKPEAMVELNPVTADLAAKMFGMESRFIGDLWKELVGGTNPTPCVIVGSVDDPRTWGVLSVWKVNFLVASPPCPPWSAIGTDSGLASPDGQLMPAILYYAAYLKVRAMCLENVPGFPKHGHFKPLLTAAALLKLPLIQGGCLDSFPAAPLVRNRWLGTFAPPKHKPEFDVMARLHHFVLVPSFTTPPTIFSNDCGHFNISVEELKELTICNEAKKILEDPSFCPDNFHRKNSQTIMEARTKTMDQPMSGLVASYGSQHQIPKTHLQQKGLYTTVLKDEQGRLRYYSPWEMVACLGWPATTVLPLDMKRLMTICGNALSSLHALAQLQRMSMILKDESPFDQMTWVDRLGKLRQNMISLKQFKQASDDRYRFLVAVQASSEPVGVHSEIAGTSVSGVVEPKVPIEVFSGVLQQDHCHGPSLSVVGLVAHDGSHRENGVEPIDLHDEESKYATTDPYGLEDVGESILQYPSMGCPTVDPTQIVEDVPCDDGATKMVVQHPAKSIQAVREVQNFLGSLVGNINGFLGTNGLPEKAKRDTSNGCVGDKRVLLVDDTWGIGIHDRFTSFLTHANDQVLVTPAQFPFLDFAHLDELLQQQVHKSDLGRAWTGARPVLYHASRNHWMKIAFVPVGLTAIETIRCILPHANHDHFIKVLINGNSVVPSSIPPGFGKMVLDFLTIPYNGKIYGPDGKCMTYSFDVTTTVADLIIYVAGKMSIHFRSLKVFHDNQPIQDGSFLCVLPMTQLSWKCNGDLKLLTLPAVHPATEQIHVPPLHSDVATTIPGPAIRLAVRHPVWGSIKTIGCGQECKVGTALEMLFPDLVSSYQLEVFHDGVGIPLHTTFAALTSVDALEIVFDDSKPLPVTRLEIIMGCDVIQQAQLGKISVPGETVPVRWVRTPFIARASEKQFPSSTSLVRLAGMFLAHCSASMAIIALINGKHTDPRIVFGETKAEDVLTFRACCLPGGAKSDDIKAMLTSQLAARGVQAGDLESRVTTVLEKLGADKLRTHLNDGHDKQWAAIKNLANLAKTRLITPQELQQFQKRKKTSKETFESGSESVAASSGSTASTSKSVPRQRTMHDFSTIKLDVSHFCSMSGPVELFCAEDFGRHQCGVTIMHTSEALKYTPLSQISEDPLAILAVGTTPILGLPVHMAPAKSANDDPILVPVTILNFGAIKVSFEAGNANAQVQVHETYTVEFWLRRSLTKNWEQAKSPMAVLGVCVPELAQGALLAHWAVKYFDKERKPTAHDKAAYVHGFLKILSSKVDPVLARSGRNGFFAIPKNSAHKPHEDFAILHMPSANLSELLAQTQKVSNALGVIETSSGYAVRCRRQHWNDIRKALLPDSPLPEEGVFTPGDSLYSLRKLDIATTPADLTKALVNLGWTSAKAIRPIGAQGWSIAAANPPPSWHLCLNDRFVIVTSNEKNVKNAALKTVSIPSNANVEPVRPKASDTPAPHVSKLVDLKSELHQEIQTIVDSKLKATNDQIVHLQQSMQRTEEDINIVKRAQLNTETKIIEVEASIASSNNCLLSQMSGMFQQLQNSLTERLDKMERNDSQDIKRPRTSEFQAMNEL